MKPSNTTAQLKRREFLVQTAGAAGAATLATLPSLASAQAAYPERPITFICPWPAGGTADQSMRALASAAGKVLGQNMVVENRAGASGMLGLKAMLSAKPDGYTVGQIPISVTRFAQLGQGPGGTINPSADITYLARTSGQTFGIAVPMNSPYATLPALVAFAKANPDKVTYAHAGVGGATHVGMEEFAQAAGIQLRHVPFRGGSEALQAVLGGHVDILADSSSWAVHVQAGRMRLLSTWGEVRTHQFPYVATLREQGYNVVVDAPNGVGAPKGLPPAVEAKLRDAFKKAVASDEFLAVLKRIDAPPLYLDGPDYAKYAAEVYRKETRLIDSLKLKELLKAG